MKVILKTSNGKEFGPIEKQSIQEAVNSLFFKYEPFLVGKKYTAEVVSDDNSLVESYTYVGNKRIEE